MHLLEKRVAGFHVSLNAISENGEAAEHLTLSVMIRVGRYRDDDIATVPCQHEWVSLVPRWGAGATSERCGGPLNDEECAVLS